MLTTRPPNSSSKRLSFNLEQLRNSASVTCAMRLYSGCCFLRLRCVAIDLGLDVWSEHLCRPLGPSEPSFRALSTTAHASYRLS